MVLISVTISLMEERRRGTNLCRYEIPWCHRQGKHPESPGAHS